MSSLRINVGCGATPTKGWINYDNSLSVLLGRLPFASRLNGYIQFCSINDVRYANALRLPHGDGSAAVIYSSHMFEHLDRAQAALFLTEVRRVLMPGGILRLAVPDLRKDIDAYIDHGNADKLMEAMLVCVPAPAGFSRRLKTALIGPRHHLWMYDAASLTSLLKRHGFVDVRSLLPGQTSIPDPGALDLRERGEESLYVEALHRGIG